jgi:endonuclease/exonuclease/phosphatase family metal-dependent hydrolase
MRLASFNVENLFSRVRAMNLDEWAEGRGVLEEYSRLNARLQKATYSAADKIAIIAGLERLGLDQTDESRWAYLRQNRGRLARRPQTGGIEIIAEGRGDWIGWVELKREAVNEVSTQMTARVIADVNADVLAVIEAEDRVALMRFDEQLLRPQDARYDQIMLIDGNDERGIDVGIMTRQPYAIQSIVSHVDDTLNNQRIFSRDCPEYSIGVGNETILILVNHLKSKGYGSSESSNARRLAQAQRVRDIYDQRRAEGIDLIAIIGDFNDTPASARLAPLMSADLRDIATLQTYVDDGRPGTYANGTASNKIDYILLSPALRARAAGAGILRMGVWGGVNGTLFPHYPEITQAVHAASDHAALFVDIDI